MNENIVDFYEQCWLKDLKDYKQSLQENKRFCKKFSYETGDAAKDMKFDMVLSFVRDMMKNTNLSDRVRIEASEVMYEFSKDAKAAATIYEPLHFCDRKKRI